MIHSAIAVLAADATPDTSGYLIAGYIVIFTVLVVYLLSLVVRFRNLRQDLDTLEELEKEDGKQDLDPAYLEKP